MAEQADKKTYKKTLNLPKTSFPMKANLVQNEPASQKRWAKANLYKQIRKTREQSPKYVFHDGPPYANGSIHLGHLLNKVLKDIVVRSKSMAGFNVPYIPGWDCHGLPIEHKVMQELGDKARGMEPIQIRRKCKSYAEKFVKLQSGQMQRLLTMADYDDPYLTMNPAYEAATLEVFADLVGKGLVTRALKPVHWSIANRTALAEAELEYEDREDTSIFVLFQLTDPGKLPGDAKLEPGVPCHLMIWTTTPWTLPANLAVAVHERYEYGVYELTRGGKKCYAVLATDLAQKVLAMNEDFQADAGNPLATFSGQDLLGMEYQHPFIDRVNPVVAADYVTLEDGTGLVHTAPGHGVEDYQTGLREGLEIYCPVLEDGTFDQTAPQWLQGGVDIWKANDLVIERLSETNNLYHAQKFVHSYPHDWRSKTPVIFRATEQWFVSVDVPAGQDGSPLREMALDVTASDVKFFPEWGRNRMRGMLESRPDWCISRQRAWGLPICAFYNNDGEPLLTRASVQAVADSFRQHGSDGWFVATPEQLLESYDASNDPDAPEWAKTVDIASLKKSTDIFDVWFESGSSWNAVIRQRFGNDWHPTDLYLEGSDQHRGWFQLSLLPSLGVTSQSPFKNVLTHGFMVDKDGRKMSKSVGNTLEVDALLKDYGADVCRWWVSSLNTDNDIKVDNEFFRLAGEEYRKVRNTLRFLLSNLSDFDVTKDSYSFTEADATTVDAWALGELNKLIQSVRDGYETFQYRRTHEALFNFCNDTMSAVYLAAVKDRLYCDAPDSAARRRTQTAIYTIADGLIRLLAPVLPHTADEAYRALTGGDGDVCVHLELFPTPSPIAVDEDWAKVIEARDGWMKAIEDARQTMNLDNPLDCGLQVSTADEFLARFPSVDLADLCGISRFKLGSAEQPTVVDLRDEPRCERSWKRDGTVKMRSDGGELSDRDAAALGLE